MFDEEYIRKIPSGDVGLYFRNLEAVARSGRTVWLRHPQIRGYTDDAETENATHKLRAIFSECAY